MFPVSFCLPHLCFVGTIIPYFEPEWKWELFRGSGENFFFFCLLDRERFNQEPDTALLFVCFAHRFQPQSNRRTAAIRVCYTCIAAVFFSSGAKEIYISPQAGRYAERSARLRIQNLRFAAKSSCIPVDFVVYFYRLSANTIYAE